MYPIIQIAGLSFPTYTLCAGLGLVVSTAVCCHLLLLKGMFSKYIYIILVGFIGVILGGRLFRILSLICISLYYTGQVNLVESMQTSGLVYFGGLLGFIFLIEFCCYIKHYNFSDISDILAIIIPLFHGFGRIGCFFAGCCYGIESDFFGVHYSVGSSHVIANRIPVQLFESVFEFLAFILLYIFYRKIVSINNFLSNKLLHLYLLFYSVARFLFEFIRGDAERGYFNFISFSQVFCIIILLYIILKDLYTYFKWKGLNKCLH